MICTGTQGQTALDFYLSLMSRTGIEDCRGPIVYLQLAKPVVVRITAAMEAVGKEQVVNNAFITRMANDPEMALFGSCAGHWLDISAVTSVVGSSLHRSDLISIGRSLALQLCAQAGWDHRELDNYMKSALESRK
jgi:hypothetical protein